MPYLSVEEASKLLVTKLQKEFPSENQFGIDLEKACEKIYGLITDLNLKDLEFVIRYPHYSKHYRLLWDYVGLKLVSVFEKNVRVHNRDSS